MYATNDTTTWRVATLLTALLGLCQLSWADGLGDRTSTTATVLGPLSLLSALALSRVNCLETRLPVALAAGAQLIVTILAVAVGLPGQERHALDGRTAVAIMVALGILAALAADRRSRARTSTACAARTARTAQGSPYAR